MLPNVRLCDISFKRALVPHNFRGTRFQLLSFIMSIFQGTPKCKNSGILKAVGIVRISNLFSKLLKHTLQGATLYATFS